jgi:hypothetical protein
MPESAQKTLILVLITCLAPIRAIALPTDKMLQPQGLNHAGIYALRQIDPNLTGDGVKFAVISRSITYIDGEPQNDYRPDISHNCFKSIQFDFHDQGQLSSGISPHSTAICSILFGEDPYAFNPNLGQFYYRGVAPAAKADVYEFWHFLVNNVFPHLPPDADVITASMGTQFEDWWTRGIDSLVEHYGIIIVAGIGNGSNAYDPPLYPGAAANVIGVGVVDSVNAEDLATKLANFALAYPEHSSAGPTGTGRSKPDIVAIGNCLAASVNDPKRYEPTGSWSSFSTPIVAGAAGLLVQKAKRDPDLSMAVSPDGGNCVIKAILMNSATKLPYWHKGRLTKNDDHSAPLDYVQGAGMLNAVAAYKHLVAGQNKPGSVPTIGWDNNLLDKNETPQNPYRITLTEPADKVITATVVWNKHYNDTYPFEPRPDKDANLRLELWAVDSKDPNNSILLDYSDSTVDNVEHIYWRADPNYTNYEIIVSFSDTDKQIETAATQRYGLAWSASDIQHNDSIFWYDLNADGVVNELDFTILVSNLANSRQSPDGYLLGDINTNGAIDVNDVEILVTHASIKADWHKTQESEPK